MTKLAVFLGNPGAQYTGTRHNAGFDFCTSLDLSSSWQKKFHGEFFKNGNIVCLRPQTYMNESGISVQEAAAFFGVKPQDILVVHDDIEIPFGTVRMQLGGGMGGHNGLRSVKTHLNTDMFRRLRLGVGRPQGQMDVASFVLAGFTEEEKKKLSVFFEEAKKKFDDFCRE